MSKANHSEKAPAGRSESSGQRIRRTRLRNRLLLIQGLAATMLIGAISWLSLGLLSASYSDLERNEVSKNISRAKGVILSKVADLSEKARDWAYWDDTYQFVQDRNPAYINSNLMTSELPIDAILYLDRSGKLFYSKQFRRLASSVPPNCDALLKEIGPARSALAEYHYSEERRGIVIHQGRYPMLCSVLPIRKSDRSGPVAGWIVFARYLDSEIISSLSTQTHLRMNISLLSHTPPGVEEVVHDLTLGAGQVVRPVNGETVEGYCLLTDIHDKPALLVKTEEPRETFAQGRRSAFLLIKSLAGVAAAFILGSLLLFEHHVLSRLLRLTQQVVAVNDLPDRRRRIDLSGSDEIAVLGSEINRMLEKLDANAQSLREREEELRLHNERLEDSVKERTEEIAYQAMHDKLTSLPNRALFMDRVQFALDKIRRETSGLAVLFIDLDNFKLINDSLGHAAGDDLIIGVASRLKQAVRPGDTVARLGGDEFTILLEELTEIADAEIVAQRIISSLAAPVLLGSSEVFACASIGIAYAEDPRHSATDLLKNADTAMYRAKAEGKSSYVIFEDWMAGHAIERLEIETELRKALDREELSIEYQPIVDIQTNRLLGCEALARWTHPSRGFISPADFIPIAEDTGLIITIGYWVLEQACKQAVEWLSDLVDPNFVMSVNLSGRQIQHSDVVQRVREILESTGLPPEHLKLEITESVLLEDKSDVVEKMFGLKELGVKLALDDFGTGYSSLSTLRTFPINTLKIDRVFINKLGQDHDAMAIVEAILVLARTMKMEVTGEGVETLEQEEILRKLECHFGQGYLYDKPLTPDQFTLSLNLKRGSVPDQPAA